MDEKKSERLEVRLDYQEKQNFVDACDTQEDTPSGAVRRFIKRYVRRSDKDLLHSAWRGAAKRRSLRPAIFGLIFIAIAGLFWGLSQRFPLLSDDAIFSARDINGDGQLEYAEHGIPPDLNNAPNGFYACLIWTLLGQSPVPSSYKRDVWFILCKMRRPLVPLKKA